jgi:hypothetical protein
MNYIKVNNSDKKIIILEMIEKFPCCNANISMYDAKSKCISSNYGYSRLKIYQRKN